MNRSSGEEAGTANPSKVSAPVLGAISAATFAIGYLRSFLFPATPLLLWGDALGYATKGVRILEGQLPYRDFFDFVTPGTQLLYALLFRINGVMLSIPNLVMCVVAAAISAWVTWCARSVVKGNLVYLPALLVIGIVLAGSFDATHHWFSTLLAMGAVAALYNGVSSGRIVVAGISSGIAASFTQSKGAALAIALLAYLYWKSRTKGAETGLLIRREITLFFTALGAFVAINLPFCLAVGLHGWYSDVIVFPLKYFGSVSANNWHGMMIELGSKSGFQKWVCLPFLYLAVPASYAWVFLDMWRRRKHDYEVGSDQLLLLALVGSSMLMMVAPALSLRRISCVSPPAMIVLASMLSRMGKLPKIAGWILGATSLVIALMQVRRFSFTIMSA